jgi:hypothetical protein
LRSRSGEGGRKGGDWVSGDKVCYKQMADATNKSENLDGDKNLKNCWIETMAKPRILGKKQKERRDERTMVVL